jgi:hypothetical protein
MVLTGLETSPAGLPFVRKKVAAHTDSSGMGRIFIDKH